MKELNHKGRGRFLKTRKGGGFRMVGVEAVARAVAGLTRS